MKLPINAILAMLTILILSCSGDSTKLGKQVAGTEKLLSDFPHWWDYHSKNIKFYKHFTPFDTDAQVIPLDSFMQKYSTGEYAVLKYTQEDTAIQYQLKKLDVDTEETIRNQLRATAYSDFADFLKIGKPLQGFGYKTIDGQIFDAATTGNKFVVMKFWFIGCLPCIAEMPELNEIVASNRARKDVVFLSIAMDPRSALQKFLKNRKFDYAVVGDKKSYLNDTLNINAYPTHMLIDKHGRVAGVCSNVNDLKEMLAAHAISH
ncbi:TlpA family protein disulfide reductase [Dyadobacter sp. CY261]|uniref:TlpA family protein disulfide reductase n=1 Tax=Dyadobacter sp. CY261 TaxID=2907203 RepID=UPI001F36FC09|nr:TlpA disulfide reductase family protein [Dyadobacter sp. CY261]MCF0072839.1 TlpA family protein disulfide reductase [Dyadobacter sp. CY261]